MKKQLNRRALLRTLAGTTFAATSLRFLVSHAQDGAYPLRFLFVYSSAGRDGTSRCSGTGANFTLGPDYAPLEEIRDKILILDGLRIPEHTSEEHPDGRCSMLTGYAAKTPVARGISFDRVLANQIANGKSIYTGHGPPGGDIDTSVSWHGANTANTDFTGGSEALAKELFPGGTTGLPPGQGGGGEEEEAPTPAPAPTPGPMPAPDTRASENELALNAHLQAELMRLRKVAPAAEFEKLDLHLQALEQLRNDAMPGGSGVGGKPLPTIPLSCGAVDLSQATNETDRVSLLLAHGFACGQASVAVHRITSEEPKHEYSHYAPGDGAQEQLRKVDVQESQTFVQLIKYLSAFQEGSGTLLDNTIVVWSSEVSGWHGDDTHGTNGMPFILAGGTGRIKTGQRIVAEGRWNAELYRAIGQTFGLSNPNSFGDTAYGTGMLEDILV